jgi:Carboxypeptidase regulatory-like domain/TonB dependent receptor
MIMKRIAMNILLSAMNAARATHDRAIDLEEAFSMHKIHLLRCPRWLPLLLLGGSFGLPLNGQVTGGSISGTVADASKSVVTNASVAAINIATGVVLHTTSNSTGYYEFPVVLPGTYTISVEAAGFSKAETNTFAVLTGQRALVDVTLVVGSVTQKVDVSAAMTQLINSTSPDLGTEVSPQKIKSLPLNERNFFPLIGLQPGVNTSPPVGRGGFEINGAPGLSSTTLIDGVDATFGDDNGIGAGSGAIINTLSVDAIDEFRTTSSVPSVQYGRASGGILTITTKSGTNAFHGQAFEFFRNNVLDANSWNNKHVTPMVALPELRYNDFGANLGGPILRNRVFFFFNYEGDRVISDTTSTGNTPTAALIASVSNPEIATELSLMPKPNETTSNPLIGYYVGNRSTTTEENTYMARGDIDLGANRLMMRYNDNYQTQAQQQFRADNEMTYPLHFQNAALEDVWTGGSNKVNEFRLGMDRNILSRHNSTYFTDPTQSWFDVTGSFNSDFQSLLYYQSTTYGLVDNFTYIRGNHTFRFGTDNRDIPARRDQNTSPYSTYASIADLQVDSPQILNVLFGGPKALVSTDFGFYAEDVYRFSARLTLTYGLRYDYFTPLKGAFNITSSDPFGPISPNKNHDFFTEGKFNFAPRVGFAFDVLGSQKLISRGGFGLMFIPPQPFYFFNSAFVGPNVPSQGSFTPSNVPPGISIAYPISKAYVEYLTANPSLIPPGPYGRFIADYNHTDQYSENWNTNLQYQFSPNLAMQVGYVGLNDFHEIATSLPNQFLPGTCPTPSCVGGIQPAPSLGIIDNNIFGGTTQYNALQLSVNYRLGISSADLFYTHSSQLQVWSGSNSAGNGQSELQNPNDGNSSRGPSDGFQRNRTTGVFVVSPPTPEFAAGNAFGRTILGGFSFQGIVNYNTGAVFNVLANKDLVRNGYTSGTRPDHVAGAPFYAKGDDHNSGGYPMWLNTAAFDSATPYNAKRYGDLGFNALYGPHTITFDGSIVKHIPLFREQNLEFRAELFNALNHANLGNPDVTMTDPNFGAILTRSTPRNVQFGLKYNF